MTIASIEANGLVEAISAAVASHWRNANDIHELARTYAGKRVTLLRRGRNAAGVTVLSTASATVRLSDDGEVYILREAARKGYVLDDAIVDILPGWDREDDVIDAIRARALELAPADLAEMPSAETLRAAAPGMRIWGSLQRRDGSVIPGATWTIAEHDADLDSLRGTYVTPSSSQPMPLSGRASEVAGWAAGLTAA